MVHSGVPSNLPLPCLTIGLKGSTKHLGTMGDGAASSALLRLPNEILHEIFEAWLPEGPEDSYLSLNGQQAWDPIAHRDFCLAVSWTSSHLRSLIIRSPKLWAHVTIYLEENTFTGDSIADLLLRRSIPHHFDLSILFIGWYGSDDTLNPLREVLKKHMSRCCSVNIRSRKGDDAPDFQLLSDIDLPYLRLLHVGAREHGSANRAHLLMQNMLARSKIAQALLAGLAKSARLWRLHSAFLRFPSLD